MHKNFRRHYFSIESILATEEQLPCTFLRDENNIGFLEPGSKLHQISAGSTLQLPYWIAACFVPYSRVATVEFPKPYKRAFRDVLKADASVVDLKSLSKFYYILGQNLIKIKHRESPEIQDILTQVMRNKFLNSFRKRFRMIMAWAFNGGTEQTRKLDWTEMRIFESARISQELLDLWMKEDNSVIKALSMVTSHRKRKINNIDLI